MVKVIDELYSEVYQNSIDNFQELKQWICGWPYLNSNDQPFLERRVWLMFCHTEIVHTYEVNYLQTFRTILKDLWFIQHVVQ